MEGTRTNDRHLVTIVSINDRFINLDTDKLELMGPVKEVKELFGCRVFVVDSLPRNKVLLVDSRNRSTLLTLKEEEVMRLIRED